MCDISKNISLGFTKDEVPVGTHMCLVYTTDKERKDSILKFLLSGLNGGERVSCFSEKVTEDNLREYFKENSISYDERKNSNAIILSGTSEVYFKDGYFDPDRMINTLTKYYNDTLDMGFAASRVIGEMTPEIMTIPGGEKLLEYESKVSILVRTSPVTAICQYNANDFDGGTIMDILKVHPKMVVNGAVVQNPFFIEPEEFLASL